MCFDVIYDDRNSSWASAQATLDVSLCAQWRTVVAVSGYYELSKLIHVSPETFKIVSAYLNAYLDVF